MFFPPPAVCACTTRLRIIARETDARYWIRVGEWETIPADITAALLDRRGCYRWESSPADFDRRVTSGVAALWVGVPVDSVPSGDYDLQTVHPTRPAEDQEGMGGHCLKIIKVALCIV